MEQFARQGAGCRRASDMVLRAARRRRGHRRQNALAAGIYRSPALRRPRRLDAHCGNR